jgi:anti-sigma B factor antagonist
MTDPLPQLLSVDTVIDGTVAHVAVAGDIDLRTAALLEDPVRRVLSEHRVSHLVIDLRGTTFLDSTGLRLLLQLNADGREQRWQLVVVRGPSSVHRTMELVGLDKQIPIVDDPAHALDDAADRPPRG